MGEKELYVMKTAQNYKVKLHILNMKETGEATAEGLKAALQSSIMQLGLMINRKE